MPAELELDLETPQPPERLDELGRQLRLDLQRQPGLEARPATRPARPGERAGEIALLGQIVLTFLSAGAATGLIACLKAYLERDRHLKFRLKRADGAELELEGSRFEPAALQESAQLLERFMAQ